ncbi:IclR family transcriptional regulator [Piscinibacter sakaiensis]|uniref:IclR family transcriptional regulator n=1 Tax=Piscinibacter sakaiensis TaxID=1547922 RepID=UPI003AB072AD
MDTNAAPEKLVGALASGLAIVRYLSTAAAPIGVSRIARGLGLNSSTCFNLLKTLVHERLVTFDDATKTYRVGLGLVELAKGALETASYARLVHPHLECIAATHRVTATLWHCASADRVVLVDRADNDGTMRVHMNVGQRLPMFISALGRSMAAHSGLTRNALRQRVAALRWDDAPSFEAYMRSVDEALSKGYAVDAANYVKGVTSVSSAVLDAAGLPVMAISGTGFSAQLTRAAIKALGEDLRDRAALVSRALSGPLPKEEALDR